MKLLAKPFYKGLSDIGLIIGVRAGDLYWYLLDYFLDEVLKTTVANGLKEAL